MEVKSEEHVTSKHTFDENAKAGKESDEPNATQEIIEGKSNNYIEHDSVEGNALAETVDEMIERTLLKQEPIMAARMASFFESLGSVSSKELGIASVDDDSDDCG